MKFALFYLKKAKIEGVPLSESGQFIGQCVMQAVRVVHALRAVPWLG